MFRCLVTSGRLFVVAVAAVGLLVAGLAPSEAQGAPTGSATPRTGLSFTNKTTADGLGANIVYGVYAVGSDIYASTAGGLSISTNGGASFTNRTASNSGLGGNDVRGAFANGAYVYAATNGGVSISTDGGTSFVNRTTANGLGDNIVRGVYAAGSSVYAGTRDPGGLAISTNGGTSFTTRTTANGLGSNYEYGVWAVGANVYVATGAGVSVSTDSGATFTNRTTADGLGNNLVLGIYVDDSTVYAATIGGISISTNGGTSFTTRNTTNGLGSNMVYGVFGDNSAIYAATANGLSVSTDGGSTFTNYTTANGLGNNRVIGVYAVGSTVYAATEGGLSISGGSNPPPPPVPPAAPGDVVAVAGDRSAVINWSSPSDSGSYPVSTYQVEASPGGRSCLVPVATTTCEITGLSNGTSYTFGVRALSGAGWGRWSSPSSAVTPGGAVIIITGGRVDRRRVAVTGVTSGPSGSMVVPWLRFAGQREAVAWVPRPVEADGTFTWSRRTSRQLQVYFAQGSVRSNTISIPGVATSLLVRDLS